ncbi:F protein [Spodoptera frugiperda multiple nucleopolyhedrovirus]|uniref:F protein n=1 Tax=Spodoptera frugiperda nuclear polyhedrosis virus TaxID=10455 RepID=A1YJ02_NPVSF|nr:F protein [Spodoptera frugiperda multiple nucleopolyhedrovirus]ABM45723.1 F protein [Spodoptera frugiperda multiple nucleopolyhedrovirus]ACA02569.1 F protein [Spodoptera frugiperda multiple nucleopolyhedrovirus]ADV91243.1 F protein [Spodoptera frugiperda multiple nucleopolyhedrovirus]AFH58980.1 F protein [Spodoptera frugiperda multiple nucleopolyhedrovirus]AIW01421.1 fusion protein [Spodoptera frugiperda multiple nucleopolyhedrovirus]
MLCLKQVFFYITAAAFLLVPIAATATTSTSNAEDIIKVTQLPSTSGLYFQHINRMQFVQNIWHFVIEMDHGSVFYRLQTIYNQAQKIHNELTKIYYKSSDNKRYDDCNSMRFIKLDLENIIHNIIPNLAQQHNLLDQKVPVTPSTANLKKVNLEEKTNTRSKRGILNFVGQVDKYLFGVMDSDDAHELHMLANTTNSLNSQVKQLTDELIVLSKYVDQLSSYSDKENVQCRIIAENFNILCRQLDEVATLYNKLDLAVDNAKLNRLNSFVISPERLLNEMRNVSGHLAGLSWPVPLTNKAVHTLVDNVINVHVFVTAERKLLFIVEVPLVSSEAFDVFHSIPLPYCDSDHKCAVLLPDSKYLGVSLDRRSYVRLDDTNTCRITDKIMLCFKPQIIYDVNQAKLCDIKIFIKNDKDIDYNRDCDIRVGKFESELFYATSDYNNWLYVLQNDIDLNIQCIPSDTRPDGMSIEPVVLHAGVGLIHATGKDNCKLTTKKSRLTVHDLYNNLNSVIEIPIGLTFNFSLALQDIDKITVDNMKINNDLEHTNLHELTNRLYDLRRQIANNTIFSGDQIYDDNNDIFAGVSQWFAGIGINFHYIKIIVMWIILALLTLAVIKIYRTCCSGACSTLCGGCCRKLKFRRTASDHTVVRRDDREMYYLNTLPRKQKNNKFQTKLDAPRKYHMEDEDIDIDLLQRNITFDDKI